MSKQLKDRAIKAIQSIPDADTRTINNVLATIYEPIIRTNVEKWCKLKGFPPKGIIYLTNKIVFSNLSIDEKLEMVDMLGKDQKFLDFGKMYNASMNKTVSVDRYFKHSKFGKFIMDECKNDNDAQVLGASANIGKGEIAFIVAGGLMKPSQGDLEWNRKVIELKEPSAAIQPHGVNHPSKFMGEMRKFITDELKKKGLNIPLPKGNHGPGDTLAELLTIKWSQTKPMGKFDFLDFAKKHKIPLATTKLIVKKFHQLVLPYTFDPGKYISASYGFDYKKYGRESFKASYLAYRKESSWNTLMVYSITKDTVYTIEDGDDAVKLWNACGEVDFSGKDKHGRAGAYGGKLHETMFKRLTNT